MDVRIRRGISTQACKGRRLRRSEISSSVLAGLLWGTGVVGLVAAVLTLAATFFFDFPLAGSAAAVDLGSDFLGPVLFPVEVTLGYLGSSVTG